MKRTPNVFLTVLGYFWADAGLAARPLRIYALRSAACRQEPLGRPQVGGRVVCGGDPRKTSSRRAKVSLTGGRLAIQDGALDDFLWVRGVLIRGARLGSTCCETLVEPGDMITWILHACCRRLEMFCLNSFPFCRCFVWNTWNWKSTFFKFWKTVVPFVRQPVWVEVETLQWFPCSSTKHVTSLPLYYFSLLA